MEKRETFRSRLGFILVSAGCAVGIGNVWKFPYICGKYGGAAFILIYLVFLAVMGIPILVCEYAVGRSSRRSCAASFHALEPEGSQFHHYGALGMCGNYLLMMFYTTVAGWMMCYFWKCLAGDFTAAAMTTDEVAAQFGALTGDPVSVTVLDTFVALMAGMIIIPACFSFGIEPGAGPSLIFITLPNIFNQMAGGRLWGALFFLFMSFAAISTIIAVFENILACTMDLWHWSRKKAVVINAAAMILLSLPCVLGFNVLSGIQPLGAGSGIMDLEDFIVSNNLLPLGSLVYLAFCVNRGGWGWENFLAEADTGKGMRFPRWARGYMRYVLPAIVVVIYVKGYWDTFRPKGNAYLIPWMIVAAAFLAAIGWIVFGKRRNVK